MWRNTDQAYGIIAIALHWLVAAAVLGLFGLGLWMVNLTYYDTWYRTAPSIHKSVGVLLFLVMALRLLWRLMNPKPAPEPGRIFSAALAMPAGPSTALAISSRSSNVNFGSLSKDLANSINWRSTSLPRCLAATSSRWTEQAGRYVTQATSSVQGASRQVADSVAAGYSQAGQLVQQRPTQSLLMSFGIGLAVGLILGLSTRSR